LPLDGKNVLVDGTYNQGSAQTLPDSVAAILSGLSTTNDSFSPSSSARSYPNVRVNAAALEFSPPEDMLWVKATERMVYSLRWASDVSGDDELVVLAGSLYLVADFYRFADPGLECALILTILVLVVVSPRYSRDTLCCSESKLCPGVKEEPPRDCPKV